MLHVVITGAHDLELLEWSLDRLPHGFSAIVVSDRATAVPAGVTRVPPEPDLSDAAAGLMAATTSVVCVVDVSEAPDLSGLVSVAEPVQHGTDDLALGARRWPTDPRSWSRRATAAVAAHELRRVSGVPLRDIGPIRVARRDDLRRLGAQQRGSGWWEETVLLAQRSGWRITEVPVPQTTPPRMPPRPGALTRSIAARRRVPALRDQIDHGAPG